MHQAFIIYITVSSFGAHGQWLFMFRVVAIPVSLYWYTSLLVLSTFVSFVSICKVFNYIHTAIRLKVEKLPVHEFT
jgi:hypothetical protein